MRHGDFDRIFEILPNLYMTTYNQILKAKHDFFQVNCTRDLPMVRSHGIRIPVDDDPCEVYTMLCSINEAVKKIDDELAIPGNKVIVHCLAAISRSPSIICAYLMWKKNMSLDAAIDYVRSIRKEAFMFSMNFRECLEEFEQQLTTINIEKNDL